MHTCPGCAPRSASRSLPLTQPPRDPKVSPERRAGHLVRSLGGQVLQHRPGWGVRKAGGRPGQRRDGRRDPTDQLPRRPPLLPGAPSPGPTALQRSAFPLIRQSPDRGAGDRAPPGGAAGLRAAGGQSPRPRPGREQGVDLERSGERGGCGMRGNRSGSCNGDLGSPGWSGFSCADPPVSWRRERVQR